MPKRTDIKSILIIGAGPIVIGQACEFDYSGAQACKALRQEGYRVVLVNSNPATIMTDPEMADATYIEPITWQTVARIIDKERPDALLPTMGGQTALNCALDLAKNGVLEKFKVELIGASREAIDKAEDREKFKQAMTRIGLASARSYLASPRPSSPVSPTPSDAASAAPSDVATPVPSVDAHEVLIAVETRGGRCVDGPCGSTVLVDRDGRVHLAAKPPNELGVVSPDLMAALDDAIRTTDFAELVSHRFTGECPTAYDGQELVFEFATPDGVQQIASCTVEVDYDAPLFMAVTAAVGEFVPLLNP